MFTVTALRRGECLACGKICEVYVVKSEKQSIVDGNLCLSDFKRIVRMSSPPINGDAGKKDADEPGRAAE